MRRFGRWIRRMAGCGRGQAPTPVDWREAVGGHWEEVGSIQFEYLRAQGLMPGHNLLDVGCGSFRAGRLFIDYLEGRRYCGLDGNGNLLEAGRREVLAPAGLLAKEPRLFCLRLSDQALDYASLLGGSFDYVWIHAVFDHMPPGVIRRCLLDLPAVLNPGGRIYATVFLNPHGDDFREPMIRPRNGSLDRAVVTFPDREYWHHTHAFFDRIVGESGQLRLDACLYDYPHPLGLRVLRFTRADAARLERREAGT